MNHDLKQRLYDYLVSKENPTPEEIELRDEVNNDLPYFQITAISRDDLKKYGYDTDKITDMDLTELASKMEESYIPALFWDDMQYFADEMELPKMEGKPCSTINTPSHE